MDATAPHVSEKSDCNNMAGFKKITSSTIVSLSILEEKKNKH